MIFLLHIRMFKNEWERAGGEGVQEEKVNYNTY